MKTLRLLGLAALLAVPDVALACTPMPPPPVPPAQQRAEALTRAQAAAEAAASPLLALRIRDAADIVVATIDGYDPGDKQDIPPTYQRNWGWYAEVGRLPVRYRFKTERVLKGTAPAVFPLKFDLPSRDFPGEWAWAVLPDSSETPESATRRDQAFWSDGSLTLFRFGSGPGDCSRQVSLDLKARYLVVRAADGKALAIEPIPATDPLPDLIAAFLADPSPEYIWRPTVQEFLALPGYVARVRVKDCTEDEVQIVERLRDRAVYPGPDVGETDELRSLTPSFRISKCSRGAEYLVTGWPFEERLHPVIDGVVHFEDRWMQLRFAGEKTMPLEDIRKLLAPAMGSS